MKILAISGDGIGAGKSSAAAKLAQETWSLAGAMRQELQRKYPAYDWFNKSQQYKATTVIAEYGDGHLTMRQVLLEYGQARCWEDHLYWVRQLADRIDLLRGIVTGVHTIGIDDLRKLCEIEYLRTRFPDRVLHVHIENPRATPEPEFDNEELRNVADYIIRWEPK